MLSNSLNLILRKTAGYNDKILIRNMDMKICSSKNMKKLNFTIKNLDCLCPIISTDKPYEMHSIKKQDEPIKDVEIISNQKIHVEKKKDEKLSYYTFNHEDLHCMKSVRIRSCSGPHFPAFRLNTERHEVSLRMQSECGKSQTIQLLQIRTLFAQCWLIVYQFYQVLAPLAQHEDYERTNLAIKIKK